MLSSSKKARVKSTRIRNSLEFNDFPRIFSSIRILRNLYCILGNFLCISELWDPKLELVLS